jgi:hypothetical protein
MPEDASTVDEPVGPEPDVVGTVVVSTGGSVGVRPGYDTDVYLARDETRDERQDERASSSIVLTPFAPPTYHEPNPQCHKA